MSSLEQAIANYQNQMTNYSEQVSQYKDFLAQTKDEGENMKESFNLEGALPLISAIAEKGAGNLFGEGGNVASSLGSLLKGDTSGLGDIVSGLKDKASEIVNNVASGDISSLSSVVNKGKSLLDNVLGTAPSEPAGFTFNNPAFNADFFSAPSESAGFKVMNPAFNADLGDVPSVPLESGGLGFAGIPEKLSLTLEDALPQFSPSAMLSAGKATFEDASSFASSFVEPLPTGSLSSNVIGRLLGGGLGNIVPESASTIAPESLVSGLMSSVRSAGGSVLNTAISGFSGAEKAGSLVSGSLGESASGLLGNALGTQSGITGTIQSALSSGESTAMSVAKSLTSTVSDAISGASGATEAGFSSLVDIPEEIAGGAEGGPAGLIIGGLIALGTTLASIFGHHDSAPPPPAMPVLSIPTSQQGLDTGN